METWLLETIWWLEDTAVVLKHSCVDENHHLPQFGKWNQEGKKEGGNYSADFDLIGILDEIPFALPSFSTEKKQTIA